MTAARALGQEALAHADALYNHARRLTRAPEDAEELVQETYVRALAGAHTFAGGNLKAWLFRILRHAFIDRYRRGRTEPVAQASSLHGDDEGDGRAIATDDGAVPDDLELHRLRGVVAGEIDAALGTLSEDARAIILLDVEGFGEAEIAEALGCAAGTVKSRLSRARALLRARLLDYAPARRWQEPAKETE